MAPTVPRDQEKQDNPKMLLQRIQNAPEIDGYAGVIGLVRRRERGARRQIRL